MKKYFLLVIICFSFICHVNAASNPYPKYEESVFGGEIINCTWYAWEQAHTKAGVDLPLWTYVQTWYSKAEKAGYSVGKVPKPNSIMVWDYGEGWGGHVAYVTKVDGNNVIFNEGGSIETSDGIKEGNSFTMDEMSSFLVGFIYLDNVPKPVEQTKTNNPVTPNKQETPPKVEETIKSSNNYLSNLLIEGININFKRDILDYTSEVEYEIENININATAEDSKSSITGNGTFPLVVGSNNFTITVTAEDKTIKEYHLTIKRKEEPKVIEITVIPEVKKQDQKPQIKKVKIITIATICIMSALITLGIIIVIIDRFSQKRNSRN